MRVSLCTIWFLNASLVFTGSSIAAEVIQLDANNWDEYVPAGKEVDCIYGDHVMRSDRIVAVVAQAIDGRNANLSILNVGGAVIDLTRRDEQNDQLSCYFPLGGDANGGHYKLSGPVAWPAELEKSSSAARIAFVATPLEWAQDTSGAKITVCYELADGADYLAVNTLLVNETNQEMTVPIHDTMRADGDFQFGYDKNLNMWWCHDEYWRGAYAIAPDNVTLMPHKVGEQLSGRCDYVSGASESGLVVPANQTLTLARALIPAGDILTVLAIERQRQGEKLANVRISVSDDAGPVAGAYLEAKQGERVIGRARVDDLGQFAARMPEGAYTWTVTAQGRKVSELRRTVRTGDNSFDFEIGLPGYVVGEITDGSGYLIPSKIAFHGQGIDDPNFGPDTAVHGVRNLWYTDDGRFRVELLPGAYELIISHGPEYDAQLATINVVQGETTRVEARLQRSVNTAGWISADLHSHASPSGDNTTSQRGRVLNLLAEHVEFIPCTEHQRISSYDLHLEYFGAAHRVLTCTGIELTGQPQPLNHQNVFPLIHRPRTQDGGAPRIDVNPVVQIARIAMWDEGSDKVVQINHPDIPQMVGDADRDTNPDRGFRDLFYYADVIEVHPPGLIFEELAAMDEEAGELGSRIQNWMQLLNLGYRLPGVVNTDAHRNFHGSGWLRNYIRSSTDDPAEADLMEICHALERGQVVMSNGPFMEVEATAGREVVGPGEDLVATEGEVDLDVRVECPNWLDVNRVQVFVNGRARERFNFRRRTRPDMFGNSAVKFDNRIKLPLDADAHVIVVAAAEGRHLGRVFGPTRGEAMPIAISNPIFVDTHANGFDPNRDLLDLPLPVEPGHRPTHGHDHP